MQKLLIDGAWVDSNSTASFHPTNPATKETIDCEFPISDWQDCDLALAAAQSAFLELRKIPHLKIAEFLENFADRIESRADEICKVAHRETGLPISPRLQDVELPRTCNQLRQAADAVRSQSWSRPTIDTQTGIRSIHAALGPVAVFGPNNFPFAFGSISGGDFAAAIAAGNPVIAKANSSHPETTKLFAEEAAKASDSSGLPRGTVQLIYRMSHEDGEKFVSDDRLAAVGYTGSRNAGLKLKSACDKVGTPIYLELSSVNPVLILPDALEERGEEIASELGGSCLLGTGQFCTSPGLVVLFEGPHTDSFVNSLTENIASAGTGILLSQSVQKSLDQSVQTLTGAGAELMCGGQIIDENSFQFSNTLLKTTGHQFLSDPATFQTEAFGNATLLVIVKDAEEALGVVRALEGNLTGCIYSHRGTSDDLIYDAIAPELRQRVGRMLNDKMPTGVAVSAAMNHGGPFPATGHPGFTAVGMPDSILRFSMLQCYDNVRDYRLPDFLKDSNPLEITRRVDGAWTRDSIAVAV